MIAWKAFLTRCSWFVSAFSKDALSAVGHLAHLKAGEVLFSTGEPCQNVFLIDEGCDAMRMAKSRE